MDPKVTWKDSHIAAGIESEYPVMVREYNTPSGSLRHAVKKTGEDPGEGWVIQPDTVPLIEDYNIPRGVHHAVSKPGDIPIIRHLFKAPDEKVRNWFLGRMEKVAEFSKKYGIAVQAWSSFGMDGIIWLTGVEGAVMMALDYPESFGMLADIVAEADYGRTVLACMSPAVDMIVQRGWYSSTDFWSPKLFDDFIFPHIAETATLAHKHGKKFGYVMTTGVEALGRRLSEAGVDVLYFVDPVQDKFPLEKTQDILGENMTLVGGMNSVTLATRDHKRICEEVRRALDMLGPTNRFILHPVDALFPDTPWESIEIVIETWNKYNQR
jgi:hypothetical protein